MNIVKNSVHLLLLFKFSLYHSNDAVNSHEVLWRDITRVKSDVILLRKQHHNSGDIQRTELCKQKIRIKVCQWQIVFKYCTNSFFHIKKTISGETASYTSI